MGKGLANRIYRANVGSIHRMTFAITALAALGGCGWTQAAVLDPKGLVGLEERDLLIKAAGLMLIVIVPVFVLTFWFAWHFRASNTAARYAPHWSYSPAIDAVVWLVPALIVVVIGYQVWTGTHKLDPYKPIEAKGAIIQIVVHLHYFLHIDFKSSPGENILALAFAAILIVLMAGGTLWIMFDLHYRMMN
jgi:heme/copper-type cytochrome/quinol oxidase subunit 2